ncbi:MAG: type II secretion system protein [Nitrospirae bacterium]|nr:type II secretion system protein [Nitrospirota bacterium]
MFNKISNSKFQISKKGFTLLEIMIALAIIGLTLVTVLHTVNYHSNVSYENIVTTQMVQLAKEKISDMETNPVNSKGNIEGTDLAFENIVSPTDDPFIIELKTVIKGQRKEIVLNELVIKKDTYK